MKCLKKGIALLTAVGMIAGAVAGCGGSGSAGDNSAQGNGGSSAAAQTEAGASGDKVVLRFAWWGGEERHNATLEAIAKYEELNPNVTIEPEYGGFDGYQQKLITQLSGNSAADIIQIDQPWLADINKQGDLLMDLSTVEAIDLSQFDETFLKNCLEFDGKVVGLPTGMNTNVFLYNKDVLQDDRFGADKTISWKELMEIGTELHAQDPDFYLLNVEQTILNLMLHSYLNQKTGEYIFNNDYERTFTEEQLAEGFQMIVDWIDNGVIEPAVVNGIYVNRWYENPKWIDGKLGICQVWLSSQSTATVDGAIDVGVMPMVRDADGVGSGVMIRPSQVYSIPSSTKYPEEATKFLNWLTNDPEASAILKDTRGVPASAAAREVLLEMGILSEENNRVVENAMAAGAMTIPNLPTGDMEQMWLDAIQEVEYKVATPEEKAKELVTDFDELLAELKGQQ
ncbi:ABC transporter substrate-binding protein [Lacrimispora sp. 210928-DFI.3.58]|uniref:ABC transporter substrate-binding protein n=1 Tax=Lacrimispora sp. 210928-DFI.3.58 TaxID=2883214 RepID=UPI0015B76D89|nr:ABC transporter substrate-binding protein [Lacrimispora sp. 210928-DFI.3.58]MCB7320766.1 ABC transporter substrate-binding protein [Lacrimispora sp. 210928-DFI.3.58]